MLVQTRRTLAAVAAAVFAAGLIPAATAQTLEEDFDTVTGSPGATVLDGQGTNDVAGFDDGIVGENAFAGTAGNTNLTAEAQGTTSGGVEGSGAVQAAISDVGFDLLAEDFTGATGTGGGSFLDGNGMADTFNFTSNWDDGLSNEFAFGGTFDGGTLVGSMSAQALTNGGMDGLGGGQIDVDNVDIGVGNWFAGLQWDIGPFPGSSPFFNPGFEDGSPGYGAQGWEPWGNAYTVDDEVGDGIFLAPNSGAQQLKLYGTFSGNSGSFQRLDAEEAQTWQIDAFSATATGDSLQFTGNLVLMRIEFLDAAETLLLSDEAVILDSSSPLDTWIDNTPLSLIAPAGTTEARCVIEFVQNMVDSGAGLIDDVSCKVIAGPVPIELGDFAVNADVLGTAGGAGEVLGDIQLRIEDLEGNRVIFPSTANGNWQALGGTLDTGTEADASGTPTPGAFNLNSGGYRVVVAFDNEAAGGTTWGTGGTLEVDNLLVPNTDAQGSTWHGGLYWNELATTASSLDELLLTADIQGSEIGGAYELRLECFKIIMAGVDEDFFDATLDGGDQMGTPFLSFDDFDQNGTTFGFSTNWDSGIEGEGAYGGLFGDASIFTGGGFTATAIAGGQTGKGGEIRAENLGFGPGGGWFAGLNWDNQGLFSTDLSQVTLTANIRGQTATGGTLGDYELRIEDAQGDRLYFPMTADGSWQNVGGTLDMASEGAALGGGGDGTFDLDSETYTVTIAFFDEAATWQFGGVLQVDNLFLTPVDVPKEIGRSTFTGTADGSFQTVGGNLSEADSTTFGSLLENFSGATATGGVTVAPYESIDGWDDGLEGESAFFGTFGAAANGTTTFQACTDCGVGGSKAGQVLVSDVDLSGGGGWFAVSFFDNVPADLSAGLEGVLLTADMRGIAGAGETLGTYFLRIEDEDLTVLTFTVLADGGYQAVGGPLSTATLEQIESGDGIFNINQLTYTVTVGMVGEPGTPDNWGPGAQLDFDNLFLTGTDVGNSDTCTVVVAFDDEINSWGTAGTLTVDNLSLAQAASCTTMLDCDDNDPCTFDECIGGNCVYTAKGTQADHGGFAGACFIDTTCDINDKFHAQNCFGNQDTEGNVGYPCEEVTPGPGVVNVDSVALGGTCLVDKVCDINDAFSADNCFGDQDTAGNPGYPCTCTGPSPDRPQLLAQPTPVSYSGLTLRGPRSVQRGDLVDVDVYLDGAFDSFRGYQLHLGVSGGNQGSLELVDIHLDDRAGYIYEETPSWPVFNVNMGQMMNGLDASISTPANAYLATFTYRVSKDATGTFSIEPLYDAITPNPKHRTFLFETTGDLIGIDETTPAIIEVSRQRDLRRLSRR